MSDFKSALEFVLENEGGYVNDPNDHGGETNYGLTKQFLIDNGYTEQAKDMKNLSKEFVRNVYLQMWNDCKANEIESQCISIYYFDCVVNHGKYQAVLFLQRAILCATFSDSIKIKDFTIDGKIGPKTIQLVNDLNWNAIYYSLRGLRVQFYCNLASTAAQKKFLNGWIKRATWDYLR